MTVSLKHNFVSAVGDGADTSLVRPSNWNDEHALTLATGKLLGRSTAGTGAAEEITVGSGLTLSAGTLSASGGFAAGTAMMFVQTSAPTGWTKSTTHNDKALRVVSGSASSGGSSAFSTVFTNQTPTITTSGLSAAATTLSTTQIPSHTHTYTGRGVANYGGACGDVGYTSANTGSTGGGGSHTHSISGSATSSAITLNVQYVDVIIATKD
jgi:hypothetical protein